MRKFITQQTTMEDLAKDPSAYGVPTFEQFSAARDKYLGREDEQFTAITEGPQKFRKGLDKIKYQLHYIDLPNEESVERALSDYGFTLADIDLNNRNSRLKKKIDMVDKGGGKYDIVVNFLP